jgi:ompA family protein
MESVRVYAKAQNRTALGIMHAYMLMNPQATLADLRKAFPNSLNPDRGVPEVFIYAEEKGTEHDWDGFFKAEDEILAMGDDRQVAVVKMWTKPSLDRLIAQAKKYGIVVAESVEADKGFGKKGSFRLEYLNGWTPPSKKGKSSLLWLWILLILLVVVGLVYYFTR